MNHTTAAIILFVIVYILISSEKIHKTIIALLGASVFVLKGIIGQEEAFAIIDWNVIFLLIGMMIIVGITKNSGLFQYIAIKTAKLARGNPVTILILLSLITAILSALLDNVTTILIIVPVTILIAVELQLSAVPFILSEAMASNIGGTATLIGDPPNIMIGSAAKLSFMDFVVNLTPVIIVIFIVFSYTIYLLWGKNMHVTNKRKARIMEFDESKIIEDKQLLIKSLIVLSLVFLGFMTHDLFHAEVSTIAIAGASVLMLITNRHETEKFFNEVEWGMIFFFIGLFILVGGLEETGVIKHLSEGMLNLTQGDIKRTSFLILWMSGLFSAFVDNIPYVATMIPLIQHMGNHMGNPAIIKPLWWALSLGACLGGNATLIGASANVIAAGLSEKNGHKITFWEFTKYGVLITVISLLISTAYIYLRFLR